MIKPLPSLSVLECLRWIEYVLALMVISEIVRSCRELKESILVMN